MPNDAHSHGSDAPAPYSSNPRERMNVAILAIGQTLFMSGAITATTLSGLIGQRLAPVPDLATLPVAVMMIGTLLATMPASLLMKRIGRRAGFLIGTAIGGITGPALAAAGVMIESFWLLCLGNLLFGVYQAFAMYYRFAAADTATGRFKAKAMSLVLVGGVAAAFIGPWNANHGQSLLAGSPEAGPFVVLVGLGILALIVLAGLKIPPPNEPSGAAERPLGEITRQAQFPVAVMAAAIGYAAMMLAMTAMPMAVRDAGFGMSEAAFVMQWHVLAMFAPSFITGHLIARYGVLTILMAGSGFFIASFATALAGTSLPHFWFALVFLGVGWNFLFVGGSALLTSTHTPDERGKVQGLNDFMVFSLSATGSLAAGAMLHYLGWSGLNASLIPMVALVAIAVLRLKIGSTGRAKAG